MRISRDVAYVCRRCGERLDHLPRKRRCPACGVVGCILEASAGDDAEATPAVSLRAIRAPAVTRLPTGIAALDRVLGGGIVVGAPTLIGGEEGAGKTTLMLQAAAGLAERVGVLYVAAEQPAHELRLYADRLGLALPRDLRIVEEPTVAAIEAALRYHPATRVLVVDSLNVISTDEGQDPGGHTQVLACAAALHAIAKGGPDHLRGPGRGPAVIAITQLNNDNRLAGSRRLRYLADAVVRFEKEPEGGDGRRLWATKNRWGPTTERGRLLMGERGLASGPA
jgi:DNA repair protein RadA/Sms